MISATFAVFPNRRSTARWGTIRRPDHRWGEHWLTVGWFCQPTQNDKDLDLYAIEMPFAGRISKVLLHTKSFSFSKVVWAKRRRSPLERSRPFCELFAHFRLSTFSLVPTDRLLSIQAITNWSFQTSTSKKSTTCVRSTPRDIPTGIGWQAYFRKLFISCYSLLLRSIIILYLLVLSGVVTLLPFWIRNTYINYVKHPKSDLTKKQFLFSTNK